MTQSGSPSRRFFSDEDSKLWQTVLVSIAKGSGPEAAIRHFEELRDAGLVPADFIPWPEAERYLRADNKEGVLMSLNPIVRDALGLLFALPTP